MVCEKRNGETHCQRGNLSENLRGEGGGGAIKAQYVGWLVFLGVGTALGFEGDEVYVACAKPLTGVFSVGESGTLIPLLTLCCFCPLGVPPTLAPA